jgi:hypothetical protein
MGATILAILRTVQNLLEGTGTWQIRRRFIEKNFPEEQVQGMDPCAALHVKFDLLNGAEKEIIFK